MNCKPGDIAAITADDPSCPSPLAGRLVDVLYASPSGKYTLPDGYPAIGNPGAWVVRFQRPVRVLTSNGSRMTEYGGCPDSKLRPIRPQADDARDESLAWLPPVPTKETVEG